MLRLLFWNLKKKPNLINPLLRLIEKRKLDVVVLSEAPDEIDEIVPALNKTTGGSWSLKKGMFNKRIQVLSSQTDEFEVDSRSDESHYLMVFPVRYKQRSLLLAAYHGISKLEASDRDIENEAINAADLLREIEGKRKNCNTILVGDFNQNPFDPGMAMAKGFFGVMSRDVAQDETKTIKFNEYPIFYNPMWSRLGDLTQGPPGTYFRGKNSHLEYFWHSYDQILIRPGLISAFDPDQFEVIVRIEHWELLENGIPNSKDFSDHLPVYLGLKLSEMRGD